MSVHRCRPSEDPRHPGRCACGQPLPRTVPTTRPRNLDFELDANRYAAKGICDYEPLFTHAQTRALRLSDEYVQDPMTVQLGVDHLRNGQEEGADWVNRLTWWLEENLDHPDRYLIEAALRNVHAAYDCVRRVID